ncbi:MAG: hypothetical protein EBR09_07580 [Proteobacteria bacterium]|jgi:hypothetical protein|nr:hypothetical protein [Pseudomonadota bacterium]
MNELVYVLTVEAIVFGLLSTVVVAQRMDVFYWPADETWPVMGTSVLVILGYSLLLLIICSVVKASRLGELAEDICHAFSRSAGRLVTTAGLWVCFQSSFIYTFEKRNWPLLLCQLWGTSCRNPGTVLWQYSYSIYMAVLLPLLVWCGGLQIVASGKLVSDKITGQTSARRIMVINVLTILIFMSSYTIQENFTLGCKQGCPEQDNIVFFDQKPGAKSVMSMRVLLLAGIIACGDLFTGALAAVIFDRANIAALILFIIIHVCQMATAPLSVMYFDLKIPYVLMWVIFGFACTLGLMDIGEALARTLLHPPEQISQDSTLKSLLHTIGIKTQAPTSSMSSIFVPIQDVQKQHKITPFSIDNTRRKRFMLTFGSKSGWPYTSTQSSTLNTGKKIK